MTDSFAPPEWLRLDPAASERLSSLVALVERWTARVNLVSSASVPHVWQRHVLDSAQLFDLAGPGELWADLGSGGGFPGLVVAILAKSFRPELRVALVESDLRKATFLREASRQLALPVTVHAVRIEDLPPLGANILSARALADLDRLCGFAHRHLAPGGLALFPKGANAAEEISRARQNWHFDLTEVPSRTDPQAHILSLRGLAHV